MTIKQAIKKAIKGGWQAKRNLDHDINIIEGFCLAYTFVKNLEEIFLDPLFWQSLGKTLGWEKPKNDFTDDKYDNWKDYWHRFIDHLAEGKTAEEFFKDSI